MSEPASLHIAAVFLLAELHVVVVFAVATPAVELPVVVRTHLGIMGVLDLTRVNLKFLKIKVGAVEFLVHNEEIIEIISRFLFSFRLFHSFSGSRFFEQKIYRLKVLVLLLF